MCNSVVNGQPRLIDLEFDNWEGQNPAVVEETANLPDAAKKFMCGQWREEAVAYFTRLCRWS